MASQAHACAIESIAAQHSRRLGRAVTVARLRGRKGSSNVARRLRHIASMASRPEQRHSGSGAEVDKPRVARLATATVHARAVQLG